MVGARAGVGSDKRTIDAWHSGGPPLGNFSAAVRRLLLLTGCTIDRRTPPASRAPAAARAMTQIVRFVPGGAFVSFPLVPLTFSLLSSFGHSLDRSLPWIPNKPPREGLSCVRLRILHSACTFGNICMSCRHIRPRSASSPSVRCY